MDTAALMSIIRYRMPFLFTRGHWKYSTTEGHGGINERDYCFIRAHTDTQTHTHILYLESYESVTWSENFLPFMDHLFCVLVYQDAIAQAMWRRIV